MGKKFYGLTGVYELEDEQEDKINEQKFEFDQDLINAVDWDGLSSEISKILGEKIKLKASVNRGRLIVSSGNIVNKGGVFQNLLKELVVEQFSTGFINQENSIWLTMSLSWETKKGGSNGIGILQAWYNLDKGKWTVRKD